MKILYLPNCYSQQRQRERKASIYPVRMAMEASYYAKNKENEVYWGWAQGRYDKIISEPEGLPFLSLPHADRTLTMAHAQCYQSNGNFKYHPGTYIQSAEGCWWGKCSFCVESGGLVRSGSTLESAGNTASSRSPSPYQVRPVEDVLQEIEECRRLGFKEVFDDSASFPTGEWLYEFIRLVHARRITMHFGCNTRIGSLPFMDMYNAGFRMLLFGVESASQYTLDRINKGVKVEDIIPTIKRAAIAGLEPHIAVMFGYAWEDDKQSIATLKLVHYLLRKGYAKTVQASFYTASNGANESQRKYVRRIYEAAYYPEFWFNQLKDIRNTADLKYLWLKIKKGLGR